MVRSIPIDNPRPVAILDERPSEPLANERCAVIGQTRDVLAIEFRDQPLAVDPDFDKRYPSALQAASAGKCGSVDGGPARKRDLAKHLFLQRL